MRIILILLWTNKSFKKKSDNEDLMSTCANYWNSKSSKMYTIVSFDQMRHYSLPNSNKIFVKNSFDLRIWFENVDENFDNFVGFNFASRSFSHELHQVFCLQSNGTSCLQLQQSYQQSILTGDMSQSRKSIFTGPWHQLSHHRILGCFADQK